MTDGADHAQNASRRRVRLPWNPLVAGAAVALIGVGAVIWSISSHTRAPSRVLSFGNLSHDELVEHLGVDPGSIVEIEDSQFTPLESRADVDAAMLEMEAVLITRAAVTPGLREAGADVWREFAHASALAIAPFLTGDLDHLDVNVQTLGGVALDSEKDRARLQSLWNLMRFPAAAPSRVEIADGRIESRNDAVRIGDLLEGKRLALRMGMRLPGGRMTTTGGRFPLVARWDAIAAPLPAYECVLPVRLEVVRSGRVRVASIGIVMAREPERGLWQPALLVLRFDQTGDKMEFHSEEELTKYAIANRPGNLHIE